MLAQLRFCALVGAISLATGASSAASAANFIFNTDPFDGTNALTTPGRQIIGGEIFIDFDSSTDRFVFNQTAFAVGNTVNFANDIVGNLSSSGLNAIVLETFDNDSDITTPFLAGTAANLLANQITTDGAGFFIYFNSALNLPRLVYSTNLSEPDADLAVLARMTNLTGNSAALAAFTDQNFSIAPGVVPEPSSWAMMLLGFGAVGGAMRSARRRQKLTVSYA